LKPCAVASPTNAPGGELVDLYRITEPYIHPISNLEPRFNFAPMQRGPVMMRWGLVPTWSKDDKAGAAMINAKAETVAEKSTFRAAIFFGTIVPVASYVRVRVYRLTYRCQIGGANAANSERRLQSSNGILFGAIAIVFGSKCARKRLQGAV
jgi:hypothetical protein